MPASISLGLFRRRRQFAGLARIGLVSIVATACINDGGPKVPTETAPVDTVIFRATLDGTQWQPTTLSVNANATGGFRLLAMQLIGLSPANIQLSVSHVTGPGRYPLGVNEQRVTGGFALVANGAFTAPLWSTPTTGEAGEVNLTTVTATRLAGTFSFVAQPNNAFGGPRTVTGGEFSVPVGTSGITILDSNAGNSFSGSVGGASFVASDVYQSGATVSGQLRLTLLNDNYIIDILVPAVTAAGVYPLGGSQGAVVTVTQSRTPFQSWGGSSATTTGSLTLSSVTLSNVTSGGRSAGTFSATVAPNGSTPGAAPLQLNGSWVVRN